MRENLLDFVFIPVCGICFLCWDATPFFFLNLVNS